MAHHRRVVHALLLSLGAALAPPAAAEEGEWPSCLLALGEGGRAHAMVVEKETEKLFLYEGQPGRPPRLVRSWNATTGQNGGDKTVRGDLRTPEGIYFFVRALEDAQLPAEYGARALVLDYPNRFDRRRGKTGDGIWLHATDEILRPLTSRRTRGCVVVTNHDVLELSRYVDLGRTPIVIEERVTRLEPGAWRAAREELLESLERWRAAWEGGDFAAYRESYAEGFRGEGLDRGAWVARKQALHARSGRIAVEVHAPTLLARGDEAIARFGQLYLSDLRREYGEKTLWLERERGSYRIVAEDWAPLPPPAALVARLGPVLAPRAATPAAVAAGPAATPAPGADLGRASASLAPPVLPEERRGRVGAAEEPPLRLERFLADAGPGEVSVQFRLSARAAAGGPAPTARSGHLAVEVRMATGRGGTSRLRWPAATRAERKKGGGRDPYSIRRYKEVEARLGGVPPGATLLGVTVFVYDGAGRLVLREDYGA